MLEGVFHVTFQSSLATMGESIAVLDACGVHGANETHVFRGRKEGSGEGALLVLEIRHVQGEKYPSFGPLSAITLDLTVTSATEEGFRASGTIREANGIRLKVVAVKLCGLAEEAC
jgi:hypothetical protein